MYFFVETLLSDAESGEDGGEDFVVGDLTDDGAEMEVTLTKIFGNEVTGEVGVESGRNAEDGSIGIGEGLIMTEVGNDDVALAHLGNGHSTRDGFAQLGYATSLLG